ncbi:diacylglycerol/lipid kinase family protein [Sphingomonas sp.]|uniref:diacylglycerol/lipid kinase family protein n=1 Tax=Sphingomonas sp. TaxID=28214 RepID=UPI002BB1430C|nr:diacylglycerol kinase family protein [Sphingomonas sp.]HTG37473.1 diacylglycerol kinase family protein [Sphingomonas sp.]
MRNLWFVTNPASGSATQEKCDAIEAVFEERGLKLVGRTGFPDEPLPDAAALAAAGADTLVLFAGDGTINAALCALSDWDGRFLILPGGTMNLLARELHDSVDPHAIIHAAHQHHETIAMPYIEAGPHRAFVGLIIGPAAQWFRAREAVRKRRFLSLLRAFRHAWGRTFGKGVRVSGSVRLRRRYQAVLVKPDPRGLDVAGVDARDWRAIAELGWNWVSGEWVSAASVTNALSRHLVIESRRPVLALFDGEPQRLERGTRITGGMSEQRFIATRLEAAA